MSILFHFGLTGGFNLWHHLSGMAGWGSIIILFFVFYYLILRWGTAPQSQADGLSTKQGVRRTAWLFFHTYAIQEVFWIIVTFAFFLMNMTGSFSRQTVPWFAGITALLFIPVLIYNYVLTWHSLRVAAGDNANSNAGHALFWIYFLATWFSAAVHMYATQVHISFGWFQPGS